MKTTLVVLATFLSMTYAQENNLIVGHNEVGLVRQFDMADMSNYANSIGQNIDDLLTIVDENPGCPLPTKGVSTYILAVNRKILHFLFQIVFFQHFVMTEIVFWKCAISRADDDTRKELKTELLKLKGYWTQTWQQEFDPTLFERDQVELLVSSTSTTVTSDAAPTPKDIVDAMYKAYKEGKADGKKFVLGQISFYQLAEKFKKRIDRVFQTPIDSNLRPTPQSDLTTMEVRHNLDFFCNFLFM